MSAQPPRTPEFVAHVQPDPLRRDDCKTCGESFTQPRSAGRPTSYCSPDCWHEGRVAAQRAQRKRAAEDQRAIKEGLTS